jgi:hypothetical protein
VFQVERKGWEDTERMHPLFNILTYLLASNPKHLGLPLVFLPCIFSVSCHTFHPPMLMSEHCVIVLFFTQGLAIYPRLVSNS